MARADARQTEDFTAMDASATRAFGDVQTSLKMLPASRTK
jgi:hypothetical protein